VNLGPHPLEPAATDCECLATEKRRIDKNMRLIIAKALRHNTIKKPEILRKT